MLTPVAGVCPICEKKCADIEQYGGISVFAGRGNVPQRVRANTVVLTKHIWLNDRLAFAAGDEIDRAHAEQLGGEWDGQDEVTVVSLDDYAERAKAEDAPAKTSRQAKK